MPIDNALHSPTNNMNGSVRSESGKNAEGEAGGHQCLVVLGCFRTRLPATRMPTLWVAERRFSNLNRTNRCSKSRRIDGLTLVKPLQSAMSLAVIKN